MINIVSQSVLRRTTSGPSKVVKNLIKGLDLIGYPYVVNKSLDACKRLWIHDDMVALSQINDLPSCVKVLVGPNLVVMPGQLPQGVSISRAVYVHPSKWAKDLWQELGFTQCPIAVWPTGIDTDMFVSTLGPKTHVLVYFKQRTQAELNVVVGVLRSRGLEYTVISYPHYSERAYRAVLKNARYIVWLGCHESQGIALQEAMAANVPILVCDVGNSVAWSSRSTDGDLLTTEQISMYPKATSAEYFDETCGFKISSLDQLAEGLDYIESHLSTYMPRDYIVRNLNLKQQARDFVGLYETHFGLVYGAGLRESLLNGGLWKEAGVKGRVKAAVKDLVHSVMGF